MKKLRIYIDTSVLGGCLDEEFAEESKALLEMAQRGDITLVLSDLLAAEVLRAPDEVKAVFETLPEESLELVERSADTERLRDMYLAAGVVGHAATDDAHHVALATWAGADVLVSWNFRHLVHFEKIRGYNSVNLREGYPALEMRSPREIVETV